MLCPYIRSSSYGAYEYCALKYYFNYNLGWSEPPNLKAQLGTIVHKVMEVLACCKQTIQQNKPLVINDEHIGEISFTKKSLSTKKFVSSVLDRSFDHYSQSDKTNNYTKKEYDTCEQWTWMALEYNNGQFDPRNRVIVAPEQEFDIPIMEDWAIMENGDRLAIKGTMDLITEVDSNTLEVIDWKGLPLYTMLPTPNGFVTMEEIQVGDKVYDQFGKVCSVVGKSKVKTKKCFRITFDDTTSVVCDDEHLWKLSNGLTVSIQDLKIGDKINVCKPIDCEEQKLPIDPYLLGIWLGYGRNRSCEITSSDPEIFDNLRNRGFEIGENLEKRSQTTESRTVLGQTNKFRKLNLLHNKHIPNIYFRASYKQRLELLRGLMDTDGNVNKTRKQAVFTSCNKRLSDDVKHLLLTLGQRPNQSIVNRDTNFKDDVVVYPIAFRPININPFSLSRKQIDLNWGSGNSSVRRIVDIEESIVQKTQCISVDSEDNTYLCTENYIPTHNTGQRKNWATGELKTYDKLQEDAQLLLYYYAISKIFPQYEYIIMTIFFIRDGGPFSMCFDDSDKTKFLSKLEKRYKEIVNDIAPKPIDKNRNDFRCKKLCHFYKTEWGNSGKSMCQYVEDNIKVHGIETTTKVCANPNFSINKYKAPGASE